MAKRARDVRPTGRVIYGGSFNPVHVGHLRLALEALRLLAPFAARLDFMPVARPPHKKSAGLLPFGLRARLLEAAIAGHSGLYCNLLEEAIPGPSWSVGTIRALRQASPEEELYFLLGSGDYQLLPEWREGLALPDLCNLAVAPRGDVDFAAFVAMSAKLWPGKVRVSENSAQGCAPGRLRWLTAGGRYRIYFLPAPYLEVSATYIRSLWLCGANIDFLTPAGVVELLNNERQVVEACWRSCN